MLEPNRDFHRVVSALEDGRPEELRDLEDGTRAAVIDHLTAMGAAAAPLLCVALDAPDGALRARAVPLLSRVRDPAAVPHLRRLLSHAHPQVRLLGAAVLGSIGTPEAIDALCECLAEPAEDLRAAIELAIVRCGAAAIPHLRSAAGSPNRAVRLAVVQTLGRFRRVELVPLLVEILESDPSLTDAVATQILGLEAGAFEPLSALLEHSNVTIRSCAARVLGQAGNARAVPLLGERARNDCVTVRLEAVAALARLGGPDAARALAAAAGDPDEAVRYRALEGFPGPLPTDAGEVVVSALADESERVRLAAAGVLARGTSRLRPGDVRRAVQLLRPRCSRWRGETAHARRVYGEALRRLERLAKELGDLPLPAPGPAHSTNLLPLPGQAESEPVERKQGRG